MIQALEWVYHPQVMRVGRWPGITFATWLGLSLLLLNGLVGLIGYSGLHGARLAAEERADTATRNLAQLVERDVSATLDRVDLALRTVTQAVQHQLGGLEVDRQSLWRLVDDGLVLVPEATNIGLFDASGQQLCGAGPDKARCRNLNVSDRDYFQQARDLPGPQTRLYGPLTSRVDAQVSLFLVRSIRRPDGSFAGLGVAIVPLQSIKAMFALLDLGEHGAVSLRHESLTLLARHPGPMRMVKEEDNRRISQQLADAIRGQPLGGSYRAPTAIDGIERSNAYRQFARYPLVIIVGLGTADYLAAWQHQRVATWALAALFAVVTTALAALVLTTVRQRAAGEAKERQILESLSEGVVLHDANGQVTDGNPAACRMLGVDRRSLIGLSAHDARWQAGPDDSALLTADTHPVVRTLQDGQAQREQVLGWRHPSLGLRWISVNTQAFGVDPARANTPAAVVSSLTDITERRTADARLREQEALFRGMFEQSIFLAGILDGNDCVLEANGKALQVLGAARDDVIGRSFASLPCWAGSPDLDRLGTVLRAAHQGQAGSFETRHVVHGGGSIDVLFNAMPERLGEGFRIAVVSIDISERQQARQALAASERRLRLASDAGGVGVWELDLDSGAAWRSDTHARLFGDTDAVQPWSRERLLQHVHEADRDLVAGQVDRAKVSGVVAYECRIRRPDGALRWISVRGEAVRKVGQTPTRLFGSVVDITERRQFEDKLRLHQEVLSNMLEGVCLVQADSACIVFTNPTFDALFGYVPGELLGQPVARLNAATERSPDERAAEIVVALAQDGRWQGDVRNRRRDGSEFWCHSTVSTLDHHEFGRVWVAVHHDITQRKSAEQALRVANRLLQTQAERDALTGLYNRRHLDDAAPRLLDEARREGATVAVLMLDIDHFKRINDEHGHRAGDAVLAAVGRLLLSGCRDGDLACRFGGEEFVLLLPHTDLAAAARRAEQWLADIRTLRVPVDDRVLQVTVSIGLAAGPQADEPIERLLARADQALYAAKAAGRDAVRVAALPAARD